METTWNESSSPIKIRTCRGCGASELEPLVSLGQQRLTGIFASERDSMPIGDLNVVGCLGQCRLVQLDRDFPPSELYGASYGYRSGLNRAMVEHLKSKIAKLQTFLALKPGDLVIDIGSNDGTSLGFYPEFCERVGVDPLCDKFAEFYGSGIRRIPGFFSEEAIAGHGLENARAITTFSMLYDLPAPVNFMKTIAATLSQDGVWVSEQSYAPSMIENRSFDTICHEHLEYYTLGTLKWLLSAAGLRPISAELNDVNGGSVSFAAVRIDSPLDSDGTFEAILKSEAETGYRTHEAFKAFAVEISQFKFELTSFITREMELGKKFGALGASTKGNVLLQYCELGPSEIQVVGDVNIEKWGKVTPGSGIPIVSESEAVDAHFDYYLVLPWHFRDFFLEKFSGEGLSLVFPLPNLEVIQS